MIKVIHGITGDCAAEIPSGDCKWSGKLHQVLAIGARSRVPPAVEGAAPTPSNAAECIVLTAVRSQRSIPRDCGWVDERG